jgi:hypothetical protein
MWCQSVCTERDHNAAQVKFILECAKEHEAYADDLKAILDEGSLDEARVLQAQKYAQVLAGALTPLQMFTEVGSFRGGRDIGLKVI